MKRLFTTLVAVALACTLTYANTYEAAEDAAKEETAKKKKKNVTYNEKGEIIKTGINLGPLPVVAIIPKLPNSFHPFRVNAQRSRHISIVTGRVNLPVAICF